jgi:c-di-GMP-binding flagellar brake protein YcgR
MRKKGTLNVTVITDMEPSDQSTNPIVQRRAHFRVPTMRDFPVDLIVWKIPPHWVLRDRPKPSMQLRVELIDLSVGGMGLKILAHRIGPEAIAVGDRLRAEFTHNNESVVLDAQIVYQTPGKEDGPARIGVAFQKLENTIEGRRAASLLNRAIACLQRRNIKQAADVSA